MRILLVVSLAAFAALPSCSQRPSVYNDPQGRYSIQVPSGWSVSPLGADAVQFASAAAYATVIVADGDDPSGVVSGIARQVGGQWRGFAEARRGATRLAGHSGVYVTYAGSNPKGIDSYLQCSAVSDAGRTYLLMLSAPKGEFTRAKPSFDQIEQSLRIGIAAQRAGEPAAPAGTGQGSNYYRMKRASVVDQHGFERPLPALSLLIPIDWQMAGNVEFKRTPGCSLELVHATFRASSADNQLGLEMFPTHSWQWSADPAMQQAMRASNQQMAQFGGRGCDVAPPMSAADFLKRMVVPGFRRDARVVSVEPLEEFAEQARQQARYFESLAVGQGVRPRIQTDAARARLEYEINGQLVEEWVTAVTFAGGMPAPSFNPMTGQMGQTTFYTCGATSVYAMRAPRGQLQSRERFFMMLLSTVHGEPEWEARVNQVKRNIQAAESKGAMDRANIWRKAGQDMHDIAMNTYNNREKTVDRTNRQFDQYIRGIETYRDPRTGETVELSNQYGRAWVNNRNEYILSDSANFDPNVALRDHNWTALERAGR